jgi:dTDP-glucose 4,6-dehydratase
MINNIIHNKPLPVYGKGENIRDWLYVEDHARAIDAIFHKGRLGEVYNIGGNNEWKNIDLVKLLCQIMDKKLSRPAGTSARLITFVNDRPGHDLRYAINPAKVITETGWRPETDFANGLEMTVDWYLANTEWLAHVTSGEYLTYYDKMYANR